MYHKNEFVSEVIMIVTLFRIRNLVSGHVLFCMYLKTSARRNILINLIMSGLNNILNMNMFCKSDCIT